MFFAFHLYLEGFHLAPQRGPADAELLADFGLVPLAYAQGVQYVPAFHLLERDDVVAAGGAGGWLHYDGGTCGCGGSGAVLNRRDVGRGFGVVAGHVRNGELLFAGFRLNVFGKVLEADDSVFRKNDGMLDDVLEFTDVARVRVTRQGVLRGRFQIQDVLAVGFLVLEYKVTY